MLLPAKPVAVSPDHQRLLEAFLSRRSAATRATYRASLVRFARWLGAKDEAHAAAWLLSAGMLEANGRVLAFLDALAADGKSAGTLATHLAALRSMVQLGRVLGLCSWGLEVRGPRVVPFRDTRGPGKAAVQALVRAAQAQRSPEKAARDAAILRLLYDLGLRRGEVAALMMKDLDFPGRRVWVIRKGALDPEPVTLPQKTAALLQAWLQWRGEAEGPLFHRLDNAATEEVFPLTGRAIRDLVFELGLAIGVRARPHGLRHSAITDALDAGHDLRTVFRFGRWQSDLSIIARYDDNRRDLGGSVADSLAEGMG